ncbi:MAG: hypothetical protein GXY37_01580 [Chloroflexi bacterium]|nr:hypothetical protein [Chloroflexota bacterium]
MTDNTSKLFFDPSLPYGLRVLNLPVPLHFHGIQVQTTKKTLFRDAPKLARQFSEILPSIKSAKSSDSYATISFQPDENGVFRYFIGRQTGISGEQKDLIHVTLQPGFYANLKVRSRPGWFLPYRLAKLRQGFHQKYLPDSPYRPSELIDEIEYYNAESRLKYFEKPAMYLLFPLAK